MKCDYAMALRYLVNGADDSIVRGRLLVVDDAIVRWDPSLGTQPTEQEIVDAFLQASKHYQSAEIRAEAAALILAKWPAWAQSNCALGIYPEATAAQCAADIAAVVTASNAAEDAVMAAITVAEVEAVTATWPTL